VAAELGFVGISTNKKTINAPMEKARELLKSLARKETEKGFLTTSRRWIHRPTSDQVTDFYLADLAAKHDLRLATLETGIKHPAVEVVSEQPPAQPTA
jgi:hypothetical protein